MPERVIIADSICLIALSNINELDIFQKVYEQITITPEIEDEFGERIPDWIKVEEVADKMKGSGLNPLIWRYSMSENTCI